MENHSSTFCFPIILSESYYIFLYLFELAGMYKFNMIFFIKIELSNLYLKYDNITEEFRQLELF